MTRTGGCLCGAVRYTAQLEGSGLGACHCGMCRKFTGGPFVAASATSVTWEQADQLRVYASSDWAERGFCATCGSSLFYRFRTDDPSSAPTILAAGSLDDLDGLVLDHEVYVDHRPSGYQFTGDLPGMTEAEVIARYAGSGN